jgi:hypothetical protein
MGLEATYTATCSKCGKTKIEKREQQPNVRLPTMVLPAGWTQPKVGQPAYTICDECQPATEVEAINEQIAELTARKATLVPPAKKTTKKATRAKG